MLSFFIFSHFYFTGYLIMYWWKRSPCKVVVVTRKPSGNRRYVEVNFLYLRDLFADPKNELSILTSISFLHYESQKNKIFENILEFREQVCHWNVLIVLGYWYITFLQSSFPINLSLFYVKIGEPLTKTSFKTLNCLSSTQ